MNLDRQYPPEILIDKQFVPFINDQLTKNEFIYKNGGLININIYELMCNPVEDKAYFKIIKLSDEKYLEIYFPFIEIKHSIPILYKEEYECKPHETTITKYIKCSKYTHNCNTQDADIVCVSSSLVHFDKNAWTIYNVKSPNETKGYITKELADNNSYKYSHSYYKAQYFESSNAFESKVIKGKHNKDFSIVMRDVCDNTTYIHNIDNPITYVMGLEFNLYEDLTN